MTLTFYKTLHILGIALILVSLGGVIMHVMQGGTREYAGRKIAAITHGIGMLIVFVAGFGMLAKLDMGGPASWGGWVYAKFAIWLVLGGLLGLIYKKPTLAKLLWFSVPVIVLLAAYIGLYKPF